MFSSSIVLTTLLLVTLYVGWLSGVKSTDTVATPGSSSADESANGSIDLAYFEQQLQLKITKSTMKNRKTSFGEAFKAAKPFPHFVISDMIPEVWISIDVV